MADPTSSLPANSVFITGMKGKIIRSDVFVTRHPCPLKTDGILFLHVNAKPNDMSQDKWDYLRSLPFGALIFGPSDDAILSLPEQTAEGDLDGDLYHAFWDEVIIDCLLDVKLHSLLQNQLDNTQGEARDQNHAEFDLGRNEEVIEIEEGREVYPNQYKKVLLRNENGETIEKYVVEKITNHRGKGRNIEIEFLWESGKRTWERLREHIENNHEIILEYAREKRLLGQPGWKSAEIRKYVREVEIMKIVSHKKTRLGLEFEVMWEDEEVTTIPEKELVVKDDINDHDNILLFEYAIEKGIMKAWTKSYRDEYGEYWFQRAVNIAKSPVKMYNDHRFVSLMWSLMNKERKEGNMQNAELFGLAYKQAIDLPKHGGKVALDHDLARAKVKSTFKHYIL